MKSDERFGFQSNFHDIRNHLLVLMGIRAAVQTDAHEYFLGVSGELWGSGRGLKGVTQGSTRDR